MPANQDQLDFWNGRMGHEWTVLQERMDANLSAIHDALMPFAAPKAGRGGAGHRLRHRHHQLGAGRCGGAARPGHWHRYFQHHAGPGPAARAGARQSDLCRDRRLARPLPAGIRPAVFPLRGDVLRRSGRRFRQPAPGGPSRAGASLLPAGARRRKMPGPARRIAAARPFLPDAPPPDPLAPGPFAFADAAADRKHPDGRRIPRRANRRNSMG